MTGAPRQKVGDWVEVRPLAEILATLDDDGALDGMPFMPEMAAFVGRRFPVLKSAHKTCDPTGASELRRLPDAVHLATRCNGAAHDGCEARCLLFWKRAWLKPVDGPTSGEAADAVVEAADLERLRAATRQATPDGETRYRCQATEIVAATAPLPPSALRHLVDDVASGNVPPPAFVSETARVATRAIVNTTLRLLRTDRSRFAAAPRSTAPAAKPKLDLAVGELVEVRPAEEILATLNDSGRNRGLSFEPEMLRHCGNTYRVAARISRIIDEKSGRMITLANDCIALEGVVCHGFDNRKRLFCPRSPYFYWREAWLRRVGGRADADQT